MFVLSGVRTHDLLHNRRQFTESTDHGAFKLLYPHTANDHINGWQQHVVTDRVWQPAAPSLGAALAVPRAVTFNMATQIALTLFGGLPLATLGLRRYGQLPKIKLQYCLTF
jgi:hypothetical protein